MGRPARPRNTMALAGPRALQPHPQGRALIMKETKSAKDLIDQRIAELGDWRGKMLAKVRAIVRAADPEILEEWKWMGTPTWSHGGIVCTGETYKNVVKMTFFKG